MRRNLHRLIVGVTIGLLVLLAANDRGLAQGDPRSRVGDLLLEGKFAEAEARAKQWLVAAERGGAESLEVADALEALIKIYAGLRRFNDAEAVWRRCLDMRLKLVGSQHALIAQTLDVMAGVYVDQGRTAEADDLWRKGLAAYKKRPAVAAIERLPNPQNPTYQEVPNLIAQKRYKEAEEVLRRNKDDAALATFLLDQGRLGEAVEVHRRLLDAAPTAERALNFATLYRQRGSAAHEQGFLERAIAIQEKTLGPGHPDLIGSLSALAASFERQNDLARAYATLKKATTVAAAVRSRQAFTTPAATALAMRKPYLDFLNIAARLMRERPGEAAAIAGETFEAGQLAIETVLNVTVSQMGLRLSQGSGKLPELIRGRQDLEREWQRLDRELLAAVTGAAAQGEKDRLRSQIASVERRMSTLDDQLRRSFPQYFEFAMPAPLKVSDLQTLIGNTEALAQFAVVGTHAYVWIVTKAAVRWARVPRTPAEIETTVSALRCGLDYEGAWSAPTRCRELLKRTYSEADSRVPRPLPFDLERSYQLYAALFGELGELIAGKQLLVVPSGPLSSLPLQVLVTRRPSIAVPVDWAGYSGAAWLARTHAITVVPSVASLKALRAQAGQSSAPNPYVAFANPVLAGPADAKSCDARGHVLPRSVRAPVARSVPARLFRGELAAVEKIRSLRPLAETANEVCAVARQAGATQQDVFLGPLATERTVKALSATGKLATYRVIHFATHGLLANETEIAAGGPAQPGLVLTPPATATIEDDGVLTSGEIAQLKLNAEWVILSACNTAGGEKTDADTLSGLARAFFYAGSRALLVSHWAVDNDATVTLITKTFEALKATPSVGRAGALRAAMLGMIATNNDPAAHPAYWAPFAVVGEGSAR